MVAGRIIWEGLLWGSFLKDQPRSFVQSPSNAFLSPCFFESMSFFSNLARIISVPSILAWWLTMGYAAPARHLPCFFMPLCLCTCCHFCLGRVILTSLSSRFQSLPHCREVSSSGRIISGRSLGTYLPAPPCLTPCYALLISWDCEHPEGWTLSHSLTLSLSTSACFSELDVCIWTFLVFVCVNVFVTYKD